MTDTITITRTVDGRTYSVDVPAVERHPGERGVAWQDALAAEVAIACALAEGPPSPKALRFIRGALGLTAARVAEVLGVRAESISRWENGVVPFDRAAWLAVGALALERAGLPTATMARAQALNEARQPPKHTKVALHRAA